MNRQSPAWRIFGKNKSDGNLKQRLGLGLQPKGRKEKIGFVPKRKCIQVVFFLLLFGHFSGGGDYWDDPSEAATLVTPVTVLRPTLGPKSWVMKTMKRGGKMWGMYIVSSDLFFGHVFGEVGSDSDFD